MHLLAGAAGLAVASPLLAEGRKQAVWKTAFGLNGFGSSSWKYKKTYPVWEVLDYASRTGFDGIELMMNWPMGGYPLPDETARVAALKRLYDAYGLRIFSLQMGAGGAFAPDADVRKTFLEDFRNRAKLIKALGGDCVGMWPGGPLKGQTHAEAVRHVAGSFREAARIGRDMGLVTAFEIEPPFIFNTEEHMKRILAEADEPALKVIYDPSQFDLLSGSTGRPDQMLTRIGIDRVGYVQLTDTDGTLRDGGTAKHLACGEGHAHVDISLATLLKGGFRGWVCIDAWEIPDPYDACTKGKQAIDRALADA
jgi:sugar phosphate isomerase/epimerase